MPNHRSQGKDVSQHPASPRGGSQPGRGSFLFAAEPNRQRVGLDFLIRLAVSAAAEVISRQKTYPLAVEIAVLVVLLIFTVWPLRHWNDRLEFYQKGMVHKGVFYPILEKTQVSWIGMRRSLLPTTFLEISGCQRRIDVSFIQDAEKLFSRAYGNAIY